MQGVWFVGGQGDERGLEIVFLDVKSEGGGEFLLVITERDYVGRESLDSAPLIKPHISRDNFVCKFCRDERLHSFG